MLLNSFPTHEGIRLQPIGLVHASLVVDASQLIQYTPAGSYFKLGKGAAENAYGSETFTRATELLLARLKETADKLEQKPDAVISIKIEMSQMKDNLCILIAYGTAVKYQH